MKKVTLILILIIYFGQIISQDVELEWVKRTGGPDFEMARSMVIDAYSNVYTVGFFIGTVDFDPSSSTFPLTSAGGTADIFIQKLDINGELLWAKQIKTELTCFTYQCRGTGIAIDDSSNVYVTGFFEGTTDFDPGPGIVSLTSAGDKDIFIQKLDSNGELIWVKGMGGPGTDVGFSIAISDSGYIYSTGQFNGTVDFAPNASPYTLSSVGEDAIFVQKLDKNGQILWAHNFGGIGFGDQGLAIAVDSWENVYTAGLFSNISDFDPSPDTSLASLEKGMFIQKLDFAGNFLWAKEIANAYPRSITVDVIGNIYTTGDFSETTDFDPGPDIHQLIALGHFSSSFVQKLDASGNFLWATQPGGDGPINYATSLNIDSEGAIYITGGFTGEGDFDPGVGTYYLNSYSTNSTHIFIQKLDIFGNFLWARQIELGTGFAIDVNNLGQIFVMGNFSDTTDFDPGTDTLTIIPAGSHDIFVLKWGQDSCANLGLVIDSVADVSCSHLGYSIGHGINGYPPYTYSWNTQPAINDSTTSIPAPGIYELSIEDSSGCSRSTSIVVGGPIDLSSFDLDANLISTQFRTGFPATVWLDVYNSGCIPTTGHLSLVLDSLTTYEGAQPVPDSMSGDTLFWTYTGLTFDSAHFRIELFLTTSITAMIGDQVCLDIEATPIIGDNDSTNNFKSYCFDVVNAVDPNDKQVYPKGVCYEGFVLPDQPLTYTVRFQNTGNADAINIFVLDTLDNYLDLGTLKIIGKSHQPMITELQDGNVLKFRFDNINLPDSGRNETLSHGYIIFQVYPLPGLALGTTIKNQASIYFDFNQPIQTNAVVNTLTDVLPPDQSTIVPISQSGSILTAQISGDAYQWINCSTQLPVIGENNVSFTPNINGSYAVVVTLGNCSYISDCIDMTSVSIEYQSKLGIKYYPNPTTGNLTIDLGKNYQTININVYNAFGKIVTKYRTSSSNRVDLSMPTEDGLYIIDLEVDGTQIYFKVVKI